MTKFNFINDVNELPDICYGVLPSDNTIIVIKKGETGYHPTEGYNDMVTGESYDERFASADKLANELNAEIDVTPEQRYTMEIRSMNGNWKTMETESVENNGHLSFDELRDKMLEADKNGETLEGVIVFTSESMGEEYSEEERSYKVSNATSKGLQNDKIGDSIWGDCLDGEDLRVRLDRYMDEDDGWQVDYCYILNNTLEESKLEEEISVDTMACAEEIAKAIEEKGCMNFTEIDDMAAEILGLSLDKLKDEQLDVEVYMCLNQLGIANNFGDGDFYTDEYAKEHPEVLEESKEVKTETVNSKRILADIRMAIPFAYQPIMDILDNGIKEGNMTEKEVTDALKSIVTHWDDETVNKIITDYKENYMEEKPELSDEEKAKNIQDTKVKDWYIENYPDDELGQEIREGLSFEDLFEAMDNYLDVYTVIGVDDSIVRERVFDKLAELMDVDYDYIYDQWLKTHETTEEEVETFLNGIKTESKEKIEEDEEDIVEVEDTIENTDALEELIEDLKSRSPLHTFVIDDILDDIDEYDGETKADRIKAVLGDILNNSPMQVSSLLYYSDTKKLFDEYMFDIEDMLIEMQDNGVAILEEVKTEHDDAEILMQTDGVIHKIVNMVYREIAEGFLSDIENIEE